MATPSLVCESTSWTGSGQRLKSLASNFETSAARCSRSGTGLWSRRKSQREAMAPNLPNGEGRDSRTHKLRRLFTQPQGQLSTDELVDLSLHQELAVGYA